MNQAYYGNSMVWFNYLIPYTNTTHVGNNTQKPVPFECLGCSETRGRKFHHRWTTTRLEHPVKIIYCAGSSQKMFGTRWWWREIQGVKKPVERFFEKSVPSLKLTKPLKIGLPNRKVVFQPSISKGELLVSGRVNEWDIYPRLTW